MNDDSVIDPVIAPFIASLNAPAIVLPVPADAPPVPLPDGKSAWCYRDAHGDVLGYVVRFDEPGKKKEFRPLTYWSSGWQFKTWPKPQPLYGYDQLAERLDAPVLIVEGEKTCDAGRGWFPDFVVVTWPGGSSNARNADWSRLAGRRVWLLPDHDEPGKKAMAVIAEALRGLTVDLSLAAADSAKPSGWDVADADWPDVATAEAWLASQHWTVLKSPQPAQPGAGSRFDDELKRANGQGPQYEARPTATYTPEIIPVPILARLEAEILRRASMQHPIAAQQTALAIAARVAGRQVVTTAGDPAGLYIALAAPSVGDLRSYQSLAQTLMQKAGLQKSVHAQRLAVIAQLHKTLWAQPALFYIPNDWGTQLQFAKRQPAGSLEVTLNALSGLWDGSDIVIETEGMKLANAGPESQQVLCAPHLTMLAGLSHDQLATAVKLSELGRGALDQIQYWILEDDDFTALDPDTTISKTPWPEDVIDHIRSLSAFHVPTGGNLAGMTGPCVPPPQVTAHFAVAVQPFYAGLDALNPIRSARSLLSTSRMIIRRVACVLAYWINPQSPVVTADLLGWSARLEIARVTQLLARFASLSSEDGKLSAYQKVLDFITAEKAGGANQRTLNRLCWPYRNLPDDKREALIKQLLNDEAIVEIQPDSKPGARRKALVYVATQFAKAVQ